MGSLLYVCKAVLFFLFVCLWRVENSYAETRHLEADVDSSEGLNQNCFFYQHSEYPRDCQEVLRGCSSLNSSGVYVIKPDGYPEPFDVYCDNDVSSSGWTVVQRRMNGFVRYDRCWDDYKAGFGFFSHEFWLGNEKLSYVTNQAVYELRVDMQLSDGSSLNVTYSGFRISDEWANYAVVTLGGYHSGGDASITSCPRNMVYANCTCHSTCEEPSGSSGCRSDCELQTDGCFCLDGFLMDGDECVPSSECPCFWSDIDRVIPNGQTKVNDDCTERRTCTNNQLVSDSEYQCDANAQCQIQDGVRQCYCNDGSQGDGQNCDPIYTDCFDAYTAGHRQDGVYLIRPTDWPGSAFNVSCVMSTDGGGWTVLQRRTGTDRQTNFYRNWTCYRDGFGSLSGDFWLGNEKMYYLTNQKRYKSRVDILTSDNTARYAEHSSFSVGTEGNKYRLTATGYSGDSGDALYYNNGKAFSTYDQDNDACETHHCAEKHRGGWWYSDDWCSNSLGSFCYNFVYGSTNAWCGQSNLNAGYNGANGENIYWAQIYNDCNLNFAEMKIRPSS